MTQTIQPPAVDLDGLRKAIQHEYTLVADQPEHGFHFLVGRVLAQLLGYSTEWLTGIPKPTIASFAGTGNPFSVAALHTGESVVDVGCGGGIDSLIAARMVGPSGHVIGVDMTPAMLTKARASAGAAHVSNTEFREGFGEALPVDDAWADVVISNGVLNLMPDKDAALLEMARVLKPCGRLQIGDIVVQKEVPQSAKENIVRRTSAHSALRSARAKRRLTRSGNKRTRR
jgi:SAM-dependent methyltransferase